LNELVFLVESLLDLLDLGGLVVYLFGELFDGEFKFYVLLIELLVSNGVLSGLCLLLLNLDLLVFDLLLKCIDWLSYDFALGFFIGTELIISFHGEYNLTDLIVDNDIRNSDVLVININIKMGNS